MVSGVRNMRGVVALVAAAASGALVQCGSSTDGADAEDPCKTLLADDCGKTCTFDQDCPDGLHCENEACTAECVPDGGQCKSGFHCDGSGRCVEDGTIIGNLDGGGAEDGFGGTGDGCVAFSLGFEKQTPTVVLLVDQSGSMTEAFGNKTRWEALRDALMDPATGIVKTLEDQVRFGLALYSSNDGSAGGECPLLTEVAIKIANYDEINTVMQSSDPVDETPTGESIEAITPDLVLFKAPGPKAIVLATDGEPDTCAEPNPQNGQPESLAAVENAFAEGVQTYVISVGSGVSDMHLQDLANAGLGAALDGSNDQPFWVATDQAGLENAFQAIINGFRGCVFDLDGAVDMADWGKGSVVLDGKNVPYEDPNGWRMNSSSELEMLGDACDTLKDGTHGLDIRFPCGSVTPIPQ